MTTTFPSTSGSFSPVDQLDSPPPVAAAAVGATKFYGSGDTEVTAEELAPVRLPEREIDVAFVPSWYLDAKPWKGAIEQAVRPKRVVAMHFAPRWTSESRTSNQRQSRARVPRIRKAYPDAVIFEAPMTSKTFAVDD